MRGLVTAGPCVRLERCAGLSTSVAGFPFVEGGLAAHSPGGALLLALRFLDLSAPRSARGGGVYGSVGQHRQ